MPPSCYASLYTFFSMCRAARWVMSGVGTGTAYRHLMHDKLVVKFHIELWALHLDLMSIWHKQLGKPIQQILVINVTKLQSNIIKTEDVWVRDLFAFNLILLSSILHLEFILPIMSEAHGCSSGHEMYFHTCNLLASLAADLKYSCGSEVLIKGVQSQWCYIVERAQNSTAM